MEFRPLDERPTGIAYAMRPDERTALLAALELRLPVSDRTGAFDRIATFLAELHAWNVRGNLVAAGDRDRLVRRHVVESLACVPLLDRLGGTALLDLGTGGGFPGIPVKLVRPSLHLVLVESRRLKSLFLQRVVSRLDLPGAQVWQVRAEALGRLPVAEERGGAPFVARVPAAGLEGPSVRPAFELVTSRAVARLDQISRWAAPLTVAGGHLVLFKGSRLEEEVQAWQRDPGPWVLAETVEEAGPNLTLLALRRTEDA